MMDRFIWWHRIRGHKIVNGISIFGASGVVTCRTCDKHWTVWWG